MLKQGVSGFCNTVDYMAPVPMHMTDSIDSSLTVDAGNVDKRPSDHVARGWSDFYLRLKILCSLIQLRP
jgi:hypothetical protein